MKKQLNQLKSPVATMVMAALASIAVAQTPITFVNATTNNTTLPNGDPLIPGTHYYVGQTWSPNDAVWDYRTGYANDGDIWQNASSGQIDTNAFRLRTTVTVPAPGPGQYYEVYALFWTDTSSWRIAASLTDAPGQLPLYLRDSPGVTQFWTGADGTQYSTVLSPNPFTTSVLISEGNRRLLMTPSLGQVVGTTISVYIEPDRNQADSNQRTWFDGIGYQLIPEPSTCALVGFGALISVLALRRPQK